MSKLPNYLIDVNVWLALVVENHEHHAVASSRLGKLSPSAKAYFNRATQQSFFRLLSQNAPTLGHPLATVRCWELYADLLADLRFGFLAEPSGLDLRWQRLTSTSLVSPKLWMDAYLQAFAELAGLKILTFDRALAKNSGGECLLGE
ncbi:MAG: TA system VapC family ribonuclease toxin [Bryobacter sp.]|nr:TA system VapC family ribonuclease toxin [Bryobacter sp.]